METKHTQGEWRVETVDNIKILAEDNSNICILTHLKHFKRRDVDEVYANAKLIAAAPELLEFALGLDAWLSFNTEPTREQLKTMRSDLQKAIKKAIK